MALLADIVSWTCLFAGSALALIGGLGLLRLPDVFARMHGAGMVDTLGLALILLGLMFQAGFTLITVKLILIMVFIDPALVLCLLAYTYALSGPSLTVWRRYRREARRSASSVGESRDI